MASPGDGSGLLVIGTGLLRTGTHSLHLALEQLLGGKCYCMFETVQQPTHLKFWHQAIMQAPDKNEWHRFFADYKATVDLPSVAFYKELIEAFPQAKVVLTVREPHRWFKSLQDTIVKDNKRIQSFPFNVMHLFSSTRELRPLIKKTIAKCFGFDAYNCMDDEVKMMAAYQRFVEDVNRHVPPHRLLVYEVKDGWEPLCDFLDLPVPFTPFPHVNTTCDFNKRVDRLMEKQLLTLGAIAVLVGVIGYVVRNKSY